MQNHIPDMTKDQIFKLRLEDAEREQLDALASLEGVSAAQMVRLLIKRAVEDRTKTFNFRISAWDGMHSTCLFWIGDDKDEAIAMTKHLAEENVGGRWTIFRAFRGDEEDPFFTAMPGETERARAKRNAK